MVDLTNQRKKTERKIRLKIEASKRARVRISKSNRFLYISFFGDDGNLMSSISSVREKGSFSRKNKDFASQLCTSAISICEKNNWKRMALDRAGYKYHGIIKIIGDSLREAGVVL